MLLKNCLYAHTFEDFIINTSSVPNNHLLLKILFTIEKVTVVFSITKYNIFCKSCTWWAWEREPADPRENWPWKKLLGLISSTQLGWGTSGGSRQRWLKFFTDGSSDSKSMSWGWRAVYVRVYFDYSPWHHFDWYYCFETLQDSEYRRGRVILYW